MTSALIDFIPAVLFFVAWWLKDIYLATKVIMIAAPAAAIWGRYRTGHWSPMPSIMAVLSVVMGALTLLMHDPLFIKLKLSVIYGVFAIAFAATHGRGQKMLKLFLRGFSATPPESLLKKLNIAWIGFWVACSGLNAFVALTMSEKVWMNMKLYGFTSLLLIFILAQLKWLVPYMDKDAIAGTPANPETPAGHPSEIVRTD